MAENGNKRLRGVSLLSSFPTDITAGMTQEEEEDKECEEEDARRLLDKVSVEEGEERMK